MGVYAILGVSFFYLVGCLDRLAPSPSPDDRRTARPGLSGWFMEFSQRASMQRTMPSA